MNSQNQTEYESFSLMDVDTQYLKIKKFQDSNEQINLSDQSIQKIAQNGQWNECLSDLEIELQAILSGRVINMDHLLQYLNKRLQPFIIFILNKIIYDHKRLKLQCYLNEILFLVQKLAFRIIKQFPIQSLELLKQIHSKIEFYNSRICEFQVYQSGINQFYNQRLNHRLQNQAESYIDNQQLICYYPLKNEIIDQQYQAKGVLIFSPFQRMQIHYFYKNGGFEILSDLITNFTLKNLNTIFILQYFQKLMDRVTYQNQFENFNIQQIIQKLSDDDIKNSNKDAINQLISMPNLFPCKNMTFIEKQANAAYFELNIYLLCLRCSSLQKRIYGLQQFCDKIQTSFSQVQQSFQNNELLLKFLTENQVFQDLFGEKTHIELIKRSFPIVKFLYLNKTIKGEDLVTILRLAKAKHETWMHSISTILQDLAEILSLEDLQIMLLYIKSDTIGLDGLNFIRSLGRNEYLENYPNRQSSELIESKFKKQKLNTQYDYRLIEIGDCNEDEKKSNNSQQKIQQNSQSEKPELLQIKKEIVEYLFKVINESPNSMIGEKAFEIAIELICHQFPSLRIQYLTFAIETLDSNNAQLPIYYYFNLIQQIIQSSYPIENFKDSMEVLFWMQKFNFKNNFLQLIMREKLNSLEKDVTEYLQIITQCVQFYKFIHQNSKIKTQEIQFLWKLLIENARCLEERDLCFDWFYEQQLLEYDALEWLFMKLIKQCHLSQSMLKCLISLIFHFNARFNILQSHFQQEYQLSDSNFIGLNILWRIFRQQPELYDQLSEFFIKLLKVKQKSDILNQLKQQYLTELFSCIQNPSSINFVIQLLEEFEGLKLMDQEEKMLITIFNQCSNALNPKQQEIKLQSNLKVYQAKQIIGQKLNPWMKPEDFDIFCKDDLFKDYKTLKDYQVSSKLTFLIKNKQDLNNENQVYHQNNQDVDEKIRNIQDIVNIQNRQFILSVLKNKNWNVDNTIGELLDRGDQLYIEYQKTNRNIENQKKVQPSSSFAFLISNQYIDQLFELLNQDNQQIKEKIWSILQVIPSNQNVYQLIEASQNDWNKLLNVDNKYRLQYHLQILKEQLIYNQMEDQDYYSNLRFNFLSQGGLQLLLNNLDNPAEIVLTILDIVSSILFLSLKIIK